MRRLAILTPAEFARKWRGCERNERAAAQEHFIDLCRLLDVGTPNEDARGASYAFEKAVIKVAGGAGYADVWKRGHFGWEYKGKHKDLAAAYQQLLEYREALENPPFLVVCDLERIEIHTNFTGTKKHIYRFCLEDFESTWPEVQRILRAVMTKPSALRTPETPAEITEEAASRFAALAGRLQNRGHDSHEVARFLNRILFCLFAEDVDLLPDKLVYRLVTSAVEDPSALTDQLSELFRKMAHQGGGLFGTERIQWFNGGLFADDAVLPLQRDDLELIADAAELDWARVEPAILGTLFERGLDPNKRSQLGAHYTARSDIERIIEPVVMRPLRREFEALKARVKKQLQANERRKEKAVGENIAARVLRLENARRRGKGASADQQSSARAFRAFLESVRAVRVLDPACGSGNFLYVILRALKDFEWEVIAWGAKELGITMETPRLGPEVVHGIELNDYAAELARVAVWIGELQWMRANGFSYNDNPILKPLNTIECRDAILDRSNPKEPAPSAWPAANFIIGNPPFLGVRKMRTELGDKYVDDLFKAWRGRVSGESDLVVYWHEKAREMIAEGRAKRAGLIATQGIRGSSNQDVLRRMKESGDIFMAFSDEPWVVEGADVRISIVCQDDGSEKERFLDGQAVDVIHPDLGGGKAGSADLTQARRLAENFGVSYMGDTKGGSFDIPEAVAWEYLVDCKRNLST